MVGTLLGRIAELEVSLDGHISDSLRSRDLAAKAMPS